MDTEELLKDAIIQQEAKGMLKSIEHRVFQL